MSLSVPQQTVIDRPRRIRGWWWVIVLWAPALLVQTLFLACLCYAGAAKTEATFWASNIVALRGVVAVTLREQNGWWRLYVALYVAIIPITWSVTAYAGFH